MKYRGIRKSYIDLVIEFISYNVGSLTGRLQVLLMLFNVT